MFEACHIEQVLRSFLHETGTERESLRLQCRTGPHPMMSYDVRTRTVFYHPASLERGYQHFPFMGTQVFLKLVFAHELGHHFHLQADPHVAAEVLAFEPHRRAAHPSPLRLRAEEAAWTHAYPLVPPRLREAFCLLRKVHLLGMRDPAAAEAWLLTRQLSHYTALPVYGASRLHKTALRQLVSWPPHPDLPDKEAVIHELVGVLAGRAPEALIRLHHEAVYVALRCGEERRLIIHPAYDVPPRVYAFHV